MLKKKHFTFKNTNKQYTTGGYMSNMYVHNTVVPWSQAIWLKHSATASRSIFTLKAKFINVRHPRVGIKNILTSIQRERQTEVSLKVKNNNNCSWTTDTTLVIIYWEVLLCDIHQFLQTYPSERYNYFTMITVLQNYGSQLTAIIQASENSTCEHSHVC